MTYFSGNTAFYNSENLKKVYSNIGLGICSLLLAVSLSQYLIADVLIRFSAGAFSNGWFYLFVSDFPLYGIGLFCFIFFVKRLQKFKIQKSNFPFLNYFTVIPVSFALMTIGAIIGGTVDSLAQIFFGVEIEDSLTTATSLMSLPIKIIYLAVIAPLGEELVFRKMILDRTAKYNEGTAILFSALVFSLFHGNFNQIFYAFAVGLVLGYSYVRTGSYLYCVLVHSVINAVYGIIVPYCYEIVTNDYASEFVNLAMGVIYLREFLTIAGIIILALYVLLKKIYIQKSIFAFAHNPLACALENPPFIVFVIFMVASALSSYVSV